jgi:hypothetical protein
MSIAEREEVFIAEREEVVITEPVVDAMLLPESPLLESIAWYATSSNDVLCSIRER